MKPHRLAVLALTGALLLPAAPADAAPKRPKTGRWTGTTAQGTKVVLDVTRKEVKLLRFDFDCDGRAATARVRHSNIARPYGKGKWGFFGYASAAALKDGDSAVKVQIAV